MARRDGSGGPRATPRSSLLAFAYAALGARGVDQFVPTRGLVPDLSADSGTAVRVGLAILLLLAPMAYTAPLFAGFSGQVDSTTYPDSWDAANDHVESADASGRLLFLPWHQYLSLSFTERRVANPAPLFFERPVVAGENIEVGGIETRASDPTHVRVRDALEHRTDPAFGDELAAVGIEYVVLAHEADYRRYAYLAEHEDFTVVFAGDDLTLYRNQAYEPAPPPSWPRRGPRVPLGSLLVGSAVTAFSSVLLVRRHAG